MSMPSRLVSASHLALRITPFVTTSTTFITRPATSPPPITRPTLMPAIRPPFPGLTRGSYRIVGARATYTIARLRDGDPGTDAAAGHAQGHGPGRPGRRPLRLRAPSG